MASEDRQRRGPEEKALDAAYPPMPPVAPACNIDRLEQSSGRVTRLEALLPSGLESGYPP